MKLTLNSAKSYLLRLYNSPTLMTWGNMVSSSVKLLILTPLILVKYNITEIAFWYLLLTINSFAIVIDFGFYPTFSRIVSYAYHGLDSLANLDGNNKPSDGKPNWDLMAKIYGTINTCYMFLSFVVIIVIFGFTYFSVHKVISGYHDAEHLWLAYYVYTFSVFISFFSKKFDSVIIGTKNVVLINRWDIVNNALNTLFSIIIVYLNLPIYCLAFNQLLFSIVLVARDYFLERSICDGKFKEFKFFSFSKEVFLWCWTPVWRSGVLVLCSTGVNQASGLIYSQVSDSRMLASYLLSLKLITTVQQFSQAPFYSKLPLFSGLRVSNKLKELSNLTATSMQKSLFVFVTGMGLLFYFGNWGLTLIHAKTSLVSNQFLIVMAFIWFLERNHSMHIQIYITTNKVPFYKTAILTAIVNLSIIFFLLPKLGIWVFPLAMGVSNLMINTWWNMKISVASLNDSILSYFKKSALWPLVLLITLATIIIIIR